jgi:hypothetical protein
VRLPDHLHVGLDADDPGEPVGEEPLVIGYGYADGFLCLQLFTPDII